MKLKYKTLTFEMNFHASLEDRYLFDKLGSIIELNEGQDEMEVSLQAYAELKKMHRMNCPEAYPKVYNPPPVTHLENQPTTSKPQEEEVKTKAEKQKEKEDSEIDKYIEAIRLAENLKILGLYNTRLNTHNDQSNPKHKQLHDAFNEKMDQLSS